jgi:hypothetical protein
LEFSSFLAVGMNHWTVYLLTHELYTQEEEEGEFLCLVEHIL